MNIPVTTNENKFHRQVLEILRTFPPISNLRNRELDLLAEIMKQYQLYKNLDKVARKEVVFSTSNRQNIRKILNISAPNMNSYLYRLRKFKLLSKDNELLPILDISTSDFNINIQLKLNEANSKGK